MADKYMQFSQSPLGNKLLKVLGLPIPPALKRVDNNTSALVENILVNECSSQPACEHLAQILDGNIVTASDSEKYGGVVYNATHIQSVDELKSLYRFFNATLRKVNASGKIVVIGIDPKHCLSSKKATAQRSLVGFIKSIAKEVGRKGVTANLIYTHNGIEQNIASPLRFLLSYRSAYVNGQVVTLNNYLSNDKASGNWQQPLEGKVALVTGASRGIGADIAKTLARDGAKVIGLDMPQAQQLTSVMQSIGGEAIFANITDENSPQLIEGAIKKIAGAVDIVVHNAGITRDKMLVSMREEQWDQVLAVNLTSIENINTHLLNNQCINNHGRIVCVSSISGIAGNVGQTNYATSKAGVIGMIESMPEQLSDQHITINAVAPGFIETDMTASIPLFTRFAGRRMSALSQGGLPIDVAETISFIASPQSQGITGNLIRVCGLNVMGS